MPPSGKLPPEAIATLSDWVQRGAPWPAGNVAPRGGAEASSFRIKPEDRQFWSFRPIDDPPLPSVRDESWPQTSLDGFVLEAIERAGLQPSPPADKAALLRRLTFDLTGLPPTLDEIDSFLADDSPQALARVVDRLLSSPHYGERWARHWLDVARYGEDQAHTFQSRKYPQGFRYRDWVVRALNDDMPYDRFVREQIAADLLAEPDRRENLSALGWFALGPVYYGDKKQLDQVDDRIDTLTRGFLGLTVACARCHDHKFDPISTQDYYALGGVIASTEYVEVPLVSNVEVEAAKQALSEDEKKRKVSPKYPLIHALKDRAEPVTLPVYARGNPENPGDPAPRRFLAILCGESVQPFSTGSGRLELAHAIADRANPLTARVIVNRIWQHHFGKGLVRTPSNFGALGERPTHPRLLDHLASRFIASGWSIKWLHRQILLSATYRQSSRFDERGWQTDPDNRLLWRMNRRRLAVEAWRDALLAVAGRLDPTLGGPSAELASAENRRRTLYGAISRHDLNPLLRLFDFPDPNLTSDGRPATTVPLQQLFVLNSEFMVGAGRAFAARLAAAAPDDAQRVREAYLLAFGRAASDDEVSSALHFLASPEAAGPSGSEGTLTRWEQLAQALLASNEFMFVD
jgi:hypothetical protein